MEERTSGPLLPLMVEIEGGVENSGQFNYHCSVWPLWRLVDVGGDVSSVASLGG